MAQVNSGYAALRLGSRAFPRRLMWHLIRAVALVCGLMLAASGLGPAGAPSMAKAAFAPPPGLYTDTSFPRAKGTITSTYVGKADGVDQSGLTADSLVLNLSLVPAFVPTDVNNGLHRSLLVDD